MAKHQLIIPEDILSGYPNRSESGQLKETRILVVNWKGTWAPNEKPEQYLVVAPGDELEITLSSERQQGRSLWLFDRTPPLLLPLPEKQRQDHWERVDIQSGSVRLEVNHTISSDSGESRYELRISELGEPPPPLLPPIGQGSPGTLTATKP